ncbi:MAG: DUF2125 domain-containing protein [Pseudomonadota bacterium]
MKRALIIIGGIAALLAVGWGMLWNAGREEVNARLDAEIAAFKTLGTEITVAKREIGGFPFAYEVRASDIVVVDSGGQRTIRLPQLTARTELSETERLVVQLPATFSLEVTPNEETRAQQPDLLEQYLIEFETIAAEVTTTGIPGAGRLVEIDAESLLMVYGDATSETSFAVELAEFTSRTEHPPQIAEAATKVAAEIGLVDYVARGKADTGAPITFEGQVEGIQMSGSSAAETLEEIRAILGGELTKGLDMTVTTQGNVSRVHTGGSDTTPAGTFTSGAGASSALVSMTDGILELKGDTRATSMQLVSDAEGPFKGGKVDIEIMDFTYSLPLAPSPDMQPFALKVAMVDVVMDDQLWSSIDPNDALDRAPAELVLDASGTMRTKMTPAEATAAGENAFEFGNVSLNALNLDMLGLSAKAKGDVELLQPLNLPVGQIDVTLENVDDVLAAMAQSGVMPPNNLMVAQLMLNSYTVLDDEGRRTAAVVMSETGITVNGQPLGGPQ